MSDASKKSSVNVDLGAKASFDFTVSTEIPAKSSGRLIDAVTDIFRPYSESRGLKADQIRLQREDVLLEIAKKAAERIAIENLSIHALPNKFLIPFMEKASLEDGDSILMDRWADLLVSSTIDPNKAHPKYVQILSEMTATDASLLRALILHRIDDVPTPQLEDLYLHSIQQRVFDAPLVYLQRDMKEILMRGMNNLEKNGDRKKFIRNIFEYIDGSFACSGVAVDDVIIYDMKEDGDFWSLALGDKVEAQVFYLSNENSKSEDILESLNLIRRFQIRMEVPKLKLYVEIFYITVTDLAVDFLISCDQTLFKKVGGQRGY